MNEDFVREGFVQFKIHSNHYYQFSLFLKANTKYFFRLNGETIFNFQMIEPSGNEWDLHIAKSSNMKNYDMVVWENILDRGEYVIRIYTISDNIITMQWGEY